ncbi:MAG: antibiotic biosynthesis monooxygenase [Actinobacteria bacterium]|nr:antibiotic biosynthesis monooxygenase [Actinomycetota bacterium]
MTTVAAVLTITPGKEDEFARKFAERGHATITAADGNHSATLARGVEDPSTYLLVSEWDSVDAHKAAMDDAGYMEWVVFARGYYAEPPHVRHYDSLD